MLAHRGRENIEVSGMEGKQYYGGVDDDDLKKGCYKSQLSDDPPGNYIRTSQTTEDPPGYFNSDG